MTPDSSRFWAADAYQPGQPQPSFDKQPLRDYLDAERRAGRWNGDAPPPPLPASVVDATSKRYLEAYRRHHRQRSQDRLSRAPSNAQAPGQKTNRQGAPHDRDRHSAGRTRWTGDHRLHQPPALPQRRRRRDRAKTVRCVPGLRCRRRGVGRGVHRHRRPFLRRRRPQGGGVGRSQQEARDRRPRLRSRRWGRAGCGCRSR